MHVSRVRVFWIVAIACVVAFVSLRVAYSPARRVRAAGASYTPRYKSGKWIRPTQGTHFNDGQLAIIIDAIQDFREPHAMTLTGKKLTDDGFSAFGEASNIYSLGLVGLDVTDAALRYLYGLDELEYLAIFDCPKISEEGVRAFQTANPEVEVVHGDGLP